MSTYETCKGSTSTIYLTINVDGSPITQSWPDEIEVCINNNIRKLKTAGTVMWDATSSKFYIKLSQSEAFTLKTENNRLQIRVKKGTEVPAAGAIHYFNAKDILSIKEI